MWALGHKKYLKFGDPFARFQDISRIKALFDKPWCYSDIFRQILRYYCNRPWGSSSISHSHCSPPHCVTSNIAVTARHGASRYFHLFSDNASNLSGVFGLRHGSSRFVTVCHGLSRSVTVCPDSNTPPIYGFRNYIFFDRQTWPKFPTNMVHSDNVFKFWIHYIPCLAYFKTRIIGIV